MRRLTIALAVLALNSAAWGQTSRAPLRRAPIALARPTVPPPSGQSDQADAAVRGSLERDPDELRSAATRGLSGEQLAGLQGAIDALKLRQNSLAGSRWRAFLARLNTGGVPMDINSLIQFVLRQSYVETNKDLQFYAEKVRYYNETKQAIRDHLSRARGLRAQFQIAAPPAFQPTTVQEPLLPSPGNPALKVTYRSQTLRSLGDLDAHIKRLEQSHVRVSDPMKAAAKGDQLRQIEEEIDAMREAAAEQLIVSVVTAAAKIAASAGGPAVRRTPPSAAAPLLTVRPGVRVQPALPPEAPAISSPEAIQGLFVTPTADLKRDATEGLTGAQQAQVNRIIGLLKGGQQTTAMQQWQGLVGQLRGAMAAQGGGANVMALLYFIMRESIIEQNEDKKYWLEKMQKQNEIAKALSDYLKELGQASTALQAKDDEEGGTASSGRKRPGVVTLRAPVVAQAGDAPPRLAYRAKMLTSESQIRAEISRSQTLVQEMSDATSLMQLQLQQTMQRQTQAFQMLSNIMKTMHDTAKAIIQNMR